MLIMVGGVLSANAVPSYGISLVSNLNEYVQDKDGYWFTFESYDSDKQQDIFTYTIDASSLDTDIYFRMHISDWGNQISPYQDGDFTFDFSDNGQWQTTGSKYEKTYFQSNTKAFCIKHTNIKANQYRITIYRSFKDEWYQEENCKVMWVKVEIISMPAPVSSLGYATFSCNRTLDFTHVTDVTAYRASSVTDGKVVLTKVTGKVPASTGLLLKADGEKVTTIPVIPTEEIDFGTNLLKASVTATEVAASTSGKYHYFLAGSNTKPVGFYNLVANKTSGAGKAYLETSTELSTSSNARAEWSFEDNEATGIQLINTNKQETFFDLQGRAVKHLTNGLYIKNGKKVIVK